MNIRSQLQNGGKLVRLILIQLFIMISFGVFYYYIGTINKDHFTMSQAMTPLDALYLSIVTQTTVGYGDISPKSPLARIVSMIQMILGYIVIANILQF